jgi:hypothetical protein
MQQRACPERTATNVDRVPLATVSTRPMKGSSVTVGERRLRATLPPPTARIEPFIDWPAIEKL